MYWFKCCHLYFLSCQITHNNISLVLRKTHNALYLCVFFSFFSFFTSLIQNIREFGAKNFFKDQRMQFTYCPYKKEVFRVTSFSERVAAKGNSQKLLDKHNHLFICASLKSILSSWQKPVYTVKIVTSEYIAFATVLTLDKFLFFAG